MGSGVMCVKMSAGGAPSSRSTMAMAVAESKGATLSCSSASAAA
jgi:hypothetical protein